MGWKLKSPPATFYLWVPVPDGYNALSFTEHLLYNTGICVSPGIGFGDMGEGYIRMALVDSDENIHEAVTRMQKAGVKYNG
jgi:LL-diaminopimelate aminotransferase